MFDYLAKLLKIKKELPIQLHKMLDFWSFNYRGNGYGYFKTYEECSQKAKEKRMEDKSGFVKEFGRPVVFLYFGDRAKNEHRRFEQIDDFS